MKKELLNERISLQCKECNAECVYLVSSTEKPHGYKFEIECKICGNNYTTIIPKKGYNIDGKLLPEFDPKNLQES